MKSTVNRRATIVGLFLFFGLVILVAGILTIGNIRNSFVKKFALITIFEEVNGLQPGNNIWFSGLKIGTVHSLKFYGKSQVEVGMRIDQEAKPYIRKDAKAKISTDGLIGSKIIVIYGGSDSVMAVVEGDTLGIEKTVSTEDMLNTLQENNKNILSITNDFKVISKRMMEGEGTVGRLLSDEALYNQIGTMATTLQRASENTEKLTASLAEFGAKMNQEGNLVNDLVSDTVLFSTIRATVAEIQRITESAAALTSSLKTAGEGLNNPTGTVGVLLHDATTATSIKTTIKNLETSTEKLNEDLEALQHNFLLRGYFRKQEKKEK
jgi:phospholipid/cholesterol/gamma-HCH transport system substrate-binding protein